MKHLRGAAAKTKNAHGHIRHATKQFKRKDWFIWAVVALILLLLLNTFLLKQRLNDANAHADAKLPKATSQLAVISLKWQNIATPSQTMYQPQQGSKLINVTAMLMNLQSVPVWLAPSVESYVTDGTGVRYGLAIAEVASPFVAGQYQPQHVAYGDLPYAVPVDMNNLEWCYELATSNGGGQPLCVPLNDYTKQ